MLEYMDYASGENVRFIETHGFTKNDMSDAYEFYAEGKLRLIISYDQVQYMNYPAFKMLVLETLKRLSIHEGGNR